MKQLQQQQSNVNSNHIAKYLSAALLGGCAMLVSPFVHAANQSCTTIPGLYTCGKTRISAVNYYGAVNLNGTTVKKDVNVRGVLRAHNSLFNTLHISGQADLSGCTVNSTTTITGYLSAQLSTFSSSIDITANNATLVGSKVYGDIHIHPSGKAKQKITLDGATIVNGDISFDKGDGTVEMTADAKLNGKVIGGTIVQK